jgi:hypothetical protein
MISQLPVVAVQAHSLLTGPLQSSHFMLMKAAAVADWAARSVASTAQSRMNPFMTLSSLGDLVLGLA